VGTNRPSRQTQGALARSAKERERKEGTRPLPLRRRRDRLGSSWCVAYATPVDSRRPPTPGTASGRPPSRRPRDSDDYIYSDRAPGAIKTNRGSVAIARRRERSLPCYHTEGSPSASALRKTSG
jgi:hypothetical protein